LDGYASTNTRTFALFLPNPAIQIIFPEDLDPALRRQGLRKINKVHASRHPGRWNQKTFGANVVRGAAKLA